MICPNKTKTIDGAAVALINSKRNKHNTATNNEPLTWGFALLGLAEGKSAVNRYCTASGLDGILLDS
jgi:hypothetical protein